MISLLQISLLAQHVSGTIIPIIRSSRVLYRWLLPVVFRAVGCVYGLRVAASRKTDTQPTAIHQTDNLKTKAPNTTGRNHLYNTLELLMMGTMVPETCWASNKICNKETILDYPDFHSLTTLIHSLTTLTEVFPCFSSVVRQIPGLNSQSRGTDRISSELLYFVLCLSLCYAIVFMLFCCYYVVLLLCCSVIICVVLCIDCVYCTTATGC